MASSTEAQKIVAVSLGKLHSSRATRSGINLYKSLMVSSVLYKARTIVIMEKYKVPYTDCEKPSADNSLETVEELQECDENTDVPTTDIDDYDYDENEENGGENQTVASQEKSETFTSKDATEDKENVCNEDTISQGKLSNNEQVLKSCENTTQNLDNKEIVKCERCTKRRITEVEAAVESISPKKVKSEDNSDNCNSSEPMDGVQITQLVDSFTSGFSGLIKNSSNILQDQTNRNSTTKSHGLSEAFNHCSTQIKESFETLSSPIMALGITA